MMSYKVIRSFVDLQDDNFAYGVGDEFPRAGKQVSQERLDELASDKNRRHTVLIVPSEGSGDSLSCACDEEAGCCASEPKKRKRNAKKSRE